MNCNEDSFHYSDFTRVNSHFPPHLWLSQVLQVRILMPKKTRDIFTKKKRENQLSHNVCTAEILEYIQLKFSKYSILLKGSRVYFYMCTRQFLLCLHILNLSSIDNNKIFELIKYFKECGGF